MKLLIIYNDTEILNVSEFSEGAAVVTPHYFMVSTKDKAFKILKGIDSRLLENY